MPSRDTTDRAESIPWKEANYEESPAEAVVTVVADVLGRSPLEMDPLYDAIDPDALNQLLRERSPSVSVTFDYCGREVTITPNRIAVDSSISGGP